MSAVDDALEILSDQIRDASFYAGRASSLLSEALSSITQDVTFTTPDDDEFNLPVRSQPDPDPARFIDAIFPPLQLFPLTPPPSITLPPQINVTVTTPSFEEGTSSTQVPKPADITPFTDIIPPQPDFPELPSFPIFSSNYNISLAYSSDLTAPNTDLQITPRVIDPDALVLSDIPLSIDTTKVDTTIIEYSQETADVIARITPKINETLTAWLQRTLSPVEAARQRLADRLTQEQTTLIDRIFNNQSGWELPGAVEAALRNELTRRLSGWTNSSQNQLASQATELENQCIASAVNWIGQFKPALEQLKAQQISLLLTAHDSALKYAKQTMAQVVLNQDIKENEATALFLQEQDTRLSIAEAELKLNQLHLWQATAQLEAEQAQQSIDAGKVKNFLSEIEVMEADVKTSVAQVAAAKAEISLKKTQTEYKLKRIELFNALLEASEANLSLQISQLESQDIEFSAEGMKIDLFEQQTALYKNYIKTQSELSDAQIARNAEIISAYQTETAATIGQYDQTIYQSEYEATRWKLGAELGLSEVEIAIKQAETDLDLLKEKQKALLDIYQTHQQVNLSLSDLELARLKAIAETNIRGADAIAGIAETVMSEATAIAKATLSEYA